jgi:transposase
LMRIVESGPNITLLPLPPKSPELYPVENLWQFIRDNWLSSASSAPTATSSTSVAMPGTCSAHR